MKNIFKDNLQTSFILGILAIIVTVLPFGGPLIGGIIGLVGIYYSRKAEKAGKKLALVSLLLNMIPVLYLLFLLFILGYTMTSR